MELKEGVRAIFVAVADGVAFRIEEKIDAAKLSGAYIKFAWELLAFVQEFEVFTEAHPALKVFVARTLLVCPGAREPFVSMLKNVNPKLATVLL